MGINTTMFKLRRDYMSNSEQFTLFDGVTKNTEPVVCLGMTFESEEARREYFREELRKKLPELKEIEGFPIGEDEDIIALSDPPYYTACPNPWVNDFIQQINNVNKTYENKQPFSEDVLEGKNDAIYNAHFYHTKVPYKAIMKYILYYTNPGDVVLDGFSGSGMTGIAAKMCNDKDKVKEFTEDENKVGERLCILSDLSPFATFITANNNEINKFKDFYPIIKKILAKVKEDNAAYIKTKHNGWLRGTLEDAQRQNRTNILDQYGEVNYVVWSDVFLCSNCHTEMVYWNLVFNGPGQPLKKGLICEKCGSENNKINLIRSKENKLLKALNEVVEESKQVPVMINYTYAGKRYEKYFDDEDWAIVKEIKDKEYNLQLPIFQLPDGVNTNQPKVSHGYQYNLQFLTDRNLYLTNAVLDEVNKMDISYDLKRFMMYLITASLQRTLKFNRYMPNHDRHVGPLSGTLYISQLTAEIPIINYMEDKVEDLLKASDLLTVNQQNIITTQSTSNLSLIDDNSVDYIFTDPPFGENLNYSELNSLFESLLQVTTNNKKEAIINQVQKKDLFDYQKLMEDCFSEMYRILKDGRWITVEFSNSKNSVWNAIQEALNKVGFIIADVRVLDKKKGTTKQMSYVNTAKQDLIISAYKPNQEVVRNILDEVNTKQSAWIFVNQHLDKLPIFQGSKKEVELIVERKPRVLFDRMVAYHVQNGLPVPISSAEFQEGIAQRFPMRDGMAFLESQVAEYDKKRTLVKEFSQMSLFVSDENSAIEWIRQQLLKKPQTRQDLHPQFMKEIQHIAKHEQLPELDSLLVQNFLRYEGDEAVPNQIATYLRSNYHDMRGLENDNSKLQDKAMNRWYVPDPNRQADLEKLREKALLREFEGYVEELASHKKKLKVFRTEAIRAGFKKAWSEKDYAKIVTVGDRLPESVIQEDDKLLMYYDNAQIRLDM